MSSLSRNQREYLRAYGKRNRLYLETGAKIIAENSGEPPAQAGVFSKSFDRWEPGRTYKLGECFVYEDCVGFSRQDKLVSSEVYPPFSVGTEALYGVRPIPDENGIYPYRYNMKASIGMRVLEGEDVYVCKSEADPLLYPPSQVPALFDKE